jgi:hypothetical protein
MYFWPDHVFVTKQYPGEKEITFPPYTCLETNGEPRLDRSKDGQIIIFPLKVSRQSLWRNLSSQIVCH